MPARYVRLAMGLLGLVMAACAGSVPPAASADPIRVDKAAPPAGSRPLGQVRAVDGHGCGLFGTLGTYEGASQKLRDQARALGADYVRVLDFTEPHPERECVDKEYVLVGVAYRSPAAERALGVASSAASTASAAPTASAPAATSSNCSAGRALEFSARNTGTGTLGVWIDQIPNAAPSGLELRYEPSTHEVALTRYPDAKTVAVADARIELGADWHAFRLERSADKVTVWLDGKLLLLYAAPAPDPAAGFAVDASGYELRGMRPGCAGISSN